MRVRGAGSVPRCADQMVDDGAGDGAGDAFDQLEPADHQRPSSSMELASARAMTSWGRSRPRPRTTPSMLGHLARHVGGLADIGLDQDVRMDGHGTPYIGGVPMAPRIEQFKDMARQAREDLFDQSHPVGRLSLVQAPCSAGDTLVTISLAGSLFFSISPNAAESKVFFYLLFTLAPFAIVSPLLGPADRPEPRAPAGPWSSSRPSAGPCSAPSWRANVHSLLLFPLAFLVLVFSEALPGDPGRAGARGGGARRRPTPRGSRPSYATLNARLTLLGTVAGFVISVPGVHPPQARRRPGVLIFASFVFVAAAVAGCRLPVVLRRHGERCGPTRPSGATTSARPARPDDRDPDLVRLQPVAHPEVLLGLIGHVHHPRACRASRSSCWPSGCAGSRVGLYFYGLALGASGIGAMVGLALVGRLRERMTEQQILLSSLWLIAVGSAGIAVLGHAAAPRCVLAFIVGLAGAWPSRPSTP